MSWLAKAIWWKKNHLKRLPAYDIHIEKEKGYKDGKFHRKHLNIFSRNKPKQLKHILKYIIILLGKKKKKGGFLLTLILHRWFSNVQKRHCKQYLLILKNVLMRENLINIYTNLKRELFSYLKR